VSGKGYDYSTKLTDIDAIAYDKSGPTDGRVAYGALLKSVGLNDCVGFKYMLQRTARSEETLISFKNV
jgi:hypothetical protein